MFDGQQGGSSYYDAAEGEVIKLIIDVSDVLDDFEHRVLRGQIKKINKETYEPYWEDMPSYKGQIMNEVGIRELMSRIMGRISKITKLSYKLDKEIYSDMFYFDMSLTELIAKKCDEWDMDIEVAKSIKDSAVELVWDVLCSSRDGFTAINLRSTYSRSDVSHTNQGDDNASGKKRSFFGLPLGSRR